MNTCPNVISTVEGTSYCALAESSVRALQKERDMWKANHDNQAELKSIIMARPDLGDRAPRVVALQKERDQYLSELESIKRGHGQLGRYEQLRLKNAELNAALDWVFANGKIIANDFASGDRDIYEIKSREELAAAVKRTP